MVEPVRPEGKLNLSAVADLHGKLMSGQGDDITVDMSQVSQIGALCAQVLVAAAKSAKSSGAAFLIENVDDDLLEQLSVMGMSADTIMGEAR